MDGLLKDIRYSIRGLSKRPEFTLLVGAAAAKFVDAFMQNVNWDEVNRRTEQMRIGK
jgi:hypothetical protein